MKKLNLYKAALDFAFANVAEVNAVTLAQKSIAAFVAGGFDPLDLQFWTQASTQARQQFTSFLNQKLPSEVVAKVEAPAAMPAANPPV